MTTLPYSLIMQIEPTEGATRVILEFDGHRFPMSIGDSSVVAEFAKDTIQHAPGIGQDTVNLDDGGTLEFGSTTPGSYINGRDDSRNMTASMILGRADALRFCDDIRRAFDEAQRYFDRDAA